MLCFSSHHIRLSTSLAQLPTHKLVVTILLTSERYLSWAELNRETNTVTYHISFSSYSLSISTRIHDYGPGYSLKYRWLRKQSGNDVAFQTGTHKWICLKENSRGYDTVKVIGLLDLARFNIFIIIIILWVLIFLLVRRCMLNPERYLYPYLEPALFVYFAKSYVQ